MNIPSRRFLAVLLLAGIGPCAMFGQQGHRATNKNLANEAELLGLNRIEHGAPGNEENSRLIEEMQHSTQMQILVINGNSLFHNMSGPLTEFKNRQDTHMQVLLANPESQFFKEESDMVYPKQLTPDQLETNKRKANEIALRLLNDSSSNDNRIEVRYYNTQFRLSMIILDGKSCYLTIRLSPHEPWDSFRLELKDGAEHLDYATQCEAHFNKLWGLSKTAAQLQIDKENNNGKWSFEQKTKFFEVLAGLLAAIAALLGVIYKSPEFLTQVSPVLKWLKSAFGSIWRLFGFNSKPSSKGADGTAGDAPEPNPAKTPDGKDGES